MAKEKSIFSCTECGATSPKWLGKCPGCGAWNTLVESVAETSSKPRYAGAGRGLERLFLDAPAAVRELELEPVGANVGERHHARSIGTGEPGADPRPRDKGTGAG